MYIFTACNWSCKTECSVFHEKLAGIEIKRGYRIVSLSLYTVSTCEHSFLISYFIHCRQHLVHNCNLLGIHAFSQLQGLIDNPPESQRSDDATTCFCICCQWNKTKFKCILLEIWLLWHPHCWFSGMMQWNGVSAFYTPSLGKVTIYGNGLEGY